ncbi:uncharacterized protein At5g50100, chloroplastic [Ricinus communis]|uniref:Thiol-disulfide oxidoreductase DCC n=1 Tax=Ricinus communis TaxID=3988 RepID=B9T7R6_RICCO|nr:uncharacterized protein At5g50100, chloroplastic [Ricinus communis]XP_048232478.1 uncharacterized protein At5g50100, chloroplastic [Ricinus communis]EEF28096.1 conserved hypothetical protein [Ricinus communis]|eukprot:XP_002534285.1 uncharacterized protein At5g50100, chloroplastic [Ricinus communis]
MAIKGVVTACNVARRGSYQSSLSVPRYLTFRFHHSSSYPPKRFTFYPTSQTGKFMYSVRAIHKAIVDPVTTKKKNEEKSTPWKIKMLYDGDCPLCMREVNMLRERNKSYDTIKFVDISSKDYSPEENQGLDYTTVMGRIHAILSDGTIVTDVEAFRRLYEQVGLGWVYAITKYEPIGSIADVVYSFWAKYRLQITGRPPLEEILVARKKKGEVCNDNNTCKM